MNPSVRGLAVVVLSTLLVLGGCGQTARHSAVQPTQSKTPQKTTPLTSASHNQTSKPVHPVSTDSSHVSGFMVFYDHGESKEEWLNHIGQLDEVFADDAVIRPTGAVENETPATTGVEAAANHARVSICVSNFGKTNFDGGEVGRILEDTRLSATLEHNLVHMVENTPYFGINIDFERVPGKDAKRFVTFLKALHTDMQHIHKTLSIDVPAKTGNSAWDSGYDFTGIGQSVDEVLIMAYDYSYPGGKPGPIAPAWWVQDAILYAMGHIPTQKIRLGLATYGYDWYGTTTKSVKQRNIQNVLNKYHAVPKWDAAAKSPFFHYKDGADRYHTVYYENASSLSIKLSIARKYDIPGVFTWYIGSDDVASWNAIHDYTPN